MADDVLARLARDLRASTDDVAFLRDADTATLDRLHAALVDAHTRQERALAEAFEGTITLVPRPLRGRVRKLLLGG